MPKETPIVEVVMDYNIDTIDEEIEMETCDTQKISRKNMKDVRILSYFQEEMIVKEDPIELEKMIA